MRIAFLLGLVSCDSFLTTPPLDQISEDQWWNDKSQTEMMVKGAYDYIYIRKKLPIEIVSAIMECVEVPPRQK